MKLVTTTPATKESSVEVQESFSIQGGIPCIDYVVNGHLVARQENHQQPVGQAFRLIIKTYVPTEPIPYENAESVDVSGIAPDVASPKQFIGTVVPEAASKKATKVAS